jgi:hypothetical protein
VAAWRSSGAPRSFTLAALATVLADVERLRSSANWQTFDEVCPLPVAQRRQLRRDHGALRSGQVPPM